MDGPPNAFNDIVDKKKEKQVGPKQTLEELQLQLEPSRKFDHFTSCLRPER